MAEQDRDQPREPQNTDDYSSGNRREGSHDREGFRGGENLHEREDFAGRPNVTEERQLNALDTDEDPQKAVDPGL